MSQLSPYAFVDAPLVDDDEALALAEYRVDTLPPVAAIAGQRYATDRAQADAADRRRGIGLGPDQPATPSEAADEAVPTATGTIVRYEAMRLPRRAVVVEQPSKRVEADFGTFEEAQTHAAQLNTWLARRPTPDARYRLYVLPPEPTAAGLVEAIDRIYDQTDREARAFEPVAALVADLLPAAETADRIKRAERKRQRREARVEHIAHGWPLRPTDREDTRA